MKHLSYMKFRRVLALLAALVLIAGLAGCRKNDDSGSSESTVPPESTAGTQAATVPETTAAPTVPETTVPETEAPKDTVEGTVLVNKLNIRKGAGTGYEEVGAYAKSDRIIILETNEDWGRTDKGWVNLAYVKLDNGTNETEKEEETEAPEEEDKETVSDGESKVLGYAVVNLGALNVRTGPGTKYDQVEMVAKGERYAYYQKSGSWIRIDKGWVSANYMYLEGETGDGAGKGTMKSDLNIRTGPGKDFDKTGTYKKGDTVKILAQINGWGYTEKGWISMSYVTMEGSASTGNGTKGTITASELNIRKEATKESDSVGLYKEGDTVTILETKDGWGKTDKGWVSMKYVELESKLSYKTGKATVNASILNIRKSASLEAEKVGTYEKGQAIEILEIKGEWGRTDKGWVAMEYVAMK